MTPRPVRAQNEHGHRLKGVCHSQAIDAREWRTRLLKATLWSVVDVEQSAVVVLQTTDAAAKICEGATHVAADPDVSSVSCQMMGFRCPTDAPIVSMAAARRIDGHVAKVGSEVGDDPAQIARKAT